MSSGADQSTIYAAAEGREFLRGALEGKDNEFINEFAGMIDDGETLDLLNYYSLWDDVGGPRRTENCMAARRRGHRHHQLPPDVRIFVFTTRCFGAIPVVGRGVVTPRSKKTAVNFEEA